MSRNNRKIRAFMARNITHKCLCIICTLLVVFSSTVSASALPLLGSITAAAEAGNTVGELFGMVLEDFFGLNHQCTLTEATLITINRSLDAIFSNTYAYDIVNPYSGSSGTYHRTGATFGQMLADMNNSIATLGTRYLSTLVSNSNGISQLTSDIKTNTTNIAATSSAMLQLINTLDWQIATLSSFGYYSTLNDAVLDQNKLSSNYSNNTVFVRVDLSNIDIYNNLVNVTLPVIPFNAEATYTDQFIIKHVYGLNNNLNGALSLTDEVYPLYYDSYSTYSSLYTDGIGRTYSSGGINAARRTLIFEVYSPILCYSFVATSPTIKYMNNGSPDYYMIMDDYYLKKISLKDNQDIVDAINNKTMTIDDTDIIDAINDLSLVDNDVKLTPVIDTDLPINGTNIVERLKMYFSTGVTVNQFFNAVDNAELGWYDQENSDVINTLSGGYVNLYE